MYEKSGQKAAIIRAIIPSWFLSHILCAGTPLEEDGACIGDSGGPLTKFIANPYPHYIQMG
jgi:hypothetical protein